MTNMFRTAYRSLTPFEQKQLAKLKDSAEELEALFKDYPKNATREMALALTNLEQAVMWAVKGITG